MISLGRVLLGTMSLASLLAFTAASGAAAHTLRCEHGITATGRMANGLNFEPPRTYDTERAARARALAAWREKVAAICPQYSTLWWRAHDKHVDCEGYAGGIACQVRALPAHKLFYFGALDR